ncbi:phosphoribosylanthranilate isomerase [Desulfoluna sp.]|uniref:phosphoribosylanthranilate isomerase n=1 Tax=Desulfoluna sp. TaxID=2045199 RepID=UPI002607D9E8|nr:phosphoribosylanthranilate isomerase [Desulfoluna sp.]
MHSPRIKICGLTSPAEAVFCVEAGVHAVGLVFFPKSPRNVSPEQAREITRVLPGEVAKVGVFVNAAYDAIMDIVDRADLSAVQLHGDEPPELAEALHRQGLTVLKAFYVTTRPDLGSALRFPSATSLVEWGKGVLPGGNALTWGDETPPLPRSRPLVIAGGLRPDTVADIIQRFRPDGVDASSGVELEPGKKSFEKIKMFTQVVGKIHLPDPIKEPFTHAPTYA